MVELELSKKAEVLQDIDGGVRYEDIATKFSISKAMITRIKQKRSSIEAKLLQNADPESKRPCRLPGDALELDRRVYLWFCKARATKVIPVTGPMLQEKALRAAAALGMTSFTASNGWLQGFRVRHNIQFRTLSGESAVVNMETVNDWMQSIAILVQDYHPDDIFNCDETGLFWRDLPTKSLIMSGESCKGGKKSKDRVTVLLTASATGEKMPLLIINNSHMPRAFKKKLPLGVHWHANAKAWMNGRVFSQYCLWLNKRIEAQGRRILLLIDIAPCHIVPETMLTTVRVLFLPSNSTSVTQPLDAGVIKNFKVKYRKLLLSYLISLVDSIDNTSASSRAWSDVTVTTISNCFRHCGVIGNRCIGAVKEVGCIESSLDGDVSTISIDDGMGEDVDELGVLSQVLDLGGGF
ncbi:hypothetical protein LEN26_007683 [Aphanomyces euteiches]|nr:hypothetical protein LEN26_007683 [Aphanomyces euteiches]